MDATMGRSRAIKRPHLLKSMYLLDQMAGLTAQVSLAKYRAAEARQFARECRSTLAQTKKRVEQSQQKIVETDKLIAELSHSILSPRGSSVETTATE
jgi:hypothetical protein